VSDTQGHPLTVIAIDGPSASGKGTVAQLVAERLGFHYLDSGAIYRAAAHAARQAGIDLDAVPASESKIAAVAGAMDLRFAGGLILLANQDVSPQLRNEECGREASKIAALPAVRTALLQRQRDFRQAPGLVADGRDMGSVVFPDAALKVFLTADVTERARRRAAQLAAMARPGDPKGLIGKENSGNIDALFGSVLADLRSRDERDAKRAVAPLAQREDARLLDTSGLSIQQAVQQVLSWYRDVKSGDAQSGNPHSASLRSHQ
jgi:cytidylate kinase